jgi:hypothetical protein
MLVSNCRECVAFLLATTIAFVSRRSMRTAHLFFYSLITCLMSLVSNAAETASPPSAPPAESDKSVFAPIAFLVGGSWRGELPPGPKGQKVEIEFKAEWASNHQAMRFDSFYLVDGKRSPYTSGMYVWNGARKQLLCIYSDVTSGIAQGYVTIEQGALVHELTVTEGHGPETKVRARITPENSKGYLSEIFLIKEGGALEKFVTVHYQRTS